jgi:hypothetical protein
MHNRMFSPPLSGWKVCLALSVVRLPATERFLSALTSDHTYFT